MDDTLFNRRRLWLFALASSLLLAMASGWMSFSVWAQAQPGGLADITEDKVQMVRTNCVAAQVSIQQLQNSDVVARTNRGRSYENILRLMAAFNARVAANKLTEPKLIEATGVMQRDATAFYKHYDSYKDTIEQLIELDCRAQPVSFYRKVQTLRQQRDSLKTDVAALDKQVADYGALVADMKARLVAPPADGATP